MKSAQINRYGNSEVIEINQNSPSLNISSGKILGNVKISRCKSDRLEDS